jgi:hypothetical protein
VCSFTIEVIDNENPSISCPNNYQVVADAAGQGALVDLTPDLANIVVNDNCGIQSKTITDPASFAPAELEPGVNVITATAVDIHGIGNTCTYNIDVVPLGACCGASPSGCIDVVRADCPDDGFWVKDTKCSEDCGMNL